MDIFSLFTLLGGLAFFLYGMNIMSGGLEKMVGGKLERVLQSMTSNKIKSLVLGAVITIAIQSSSAMTVMLVGLVNSGIMELGQTTVVTMGSSVGTTLTAWILSATGIQSDNFFLRLLKPESFSPIMALIGILLVTQKKNDRRKNIGSILLGFAILMFGMTLMSESVSPLAEMPFFQEMLVLFDNPLLGLLIGTVFTGVIQSSAATVGIIQSLSMTGSITFGMAIPLIIGANIGTCVTGLLSAIGASKNAKRVVAVTIYFKVIGAALCMTAFYALHALFRFEFVDQPINVLWVAIIHTAFNVINTVVLLPFSRQLEALARKTVKDSGGQKELLDERLLNAPGLAIAECRKLTVQMAKTARDSMLTAIDILFDYDSKKANDIREMEESIDTYEDKLGTFLVKLSGRSLTVHDSNVAAEMLHTIGDFERIGDHAVNLLRAAEEIHDKELQFSTAARQELDVMTRAIIDIMNLTVDAFEQDDTTLAGRVEPLEQVIDSLKLVLKDRHIHRLQSGLCTIELGFVLSDVLTNYERVSDHCSNIAVAVIQIKKSSLDTHGYLNEVKAGGDEEFDLAFDAYRARYELPPAVAGAESLQGQEVLAEFR